MARLIARGVGQLATVVVMRPTRFFSILARRGKHETAAR